MKRLIAVLLVLCFALGSTALAEGKLKVTDKTLIVYDGDDNGYFFARIENTGDAPITVSTGNLVTFNDEDEIIFTDSYVAICPGYVTLEPGEAVFACEYVWETALKQQVVADYKFSGEKSSSGDPITIMPAGITYELKGAGTGNNKLYVTITNDSDEMLDAPYVVGVLYDEEGHIAWVDVENFSALRIHPDSTVTVAMSVDNDMMVYYAGHGIKVDRAEAFVYIDK